MKIVMINGSMRKENTYNIGKNLIDKIKEDGDIVKEFFLPKDLPKFCEGCSNCFLKMEDTCPHYSYTKIIAKAMDEAELLVFTSPVYAYHISGQMKAFLDHYTYRWMVHRPRKGMFKKKAVIITTASSIGIKSTNKDIKDSLFYWGIGRIYNYGKSLGPYSWEDISSRDKELINLDMQFLADKIKKRRVNDRPCLKTRLFFYYIRMMHNRGKYLKIDRDYWDRQGWLGSERPWDKEV